MKANNDEIKNDDFVVRINYSLTALFVIIMSLITAVCIGLYPKIEKNTKEKLNIYENYEIANYLGNTNYVLLNKTLENPKDYSTLLLDYLDLGNIAKTEKKEATADTKELLTKWDKQLETGLKNLEYYMVNNESKKVVTNNQVLGNAITATDFEKLSKEYGFFTVVTYNNEGVPTVTYSKGMTKDSLQRYANNIKYGHTVGEYFYEDRKLTDQEIAEYTTNDEMFSYDKRTDGIYGIDMKTDTYKLSSDKGETFLLSPVKNMTVVYAINKSPAYSDLITDATYRMENEFQIGFTVFCVLAAMALMALITMFVPYRMEKDMAATRVVLRFPVEVLAGLIFMAVLGVMFTCIAVLPATVSDSIEIMLHGVAVTGKAQEIVIYLIRFGSVFLCLTATVFTMVLIKNMFHIGIIRYFIENTLAIRILRAIGRQVKKVIYFFTTIDLSKNGTKKLLLIFLAHGTIIFFLCCFWFFGAFLAIAYMAVLFVVLRRRYIKIQKDYQTLSEKTRTIANGDLDISIDEDLGLFNPLKEDINNIKNGLKNAVEQEVKSQNMKTELITNVSHDLKTPLTSIITYVDILKQDNITDEQRNEYIDILDRKSQRLKVLIEDLFEMSKTTSNNITLDCQNIDLVTLNREVSVEFEDKLSEAGLVVKSEYRQDKVICYLDSQRTYRILENLYGNLVKYAMPNTRVYVTVEQVENQGMITIKNVSSNELNFDGSHLMERFVRGDVSRNTEGSGLGLAIAKGLVEAQGGTMNIEIDGDLFKVIITFPISEVVEEIPEQQEVPEDETVEESKDWLKDFYIQTEKVELPEDDETLGE